MAASGLSDRSSFCFKLACLVLRQVPTCIWKRQILLISQLSFYIGYFFNCYLGVPLPVLGHSQGDSLTNLMLITAYVPILPEGHWEPCNKVGCLSPAEHLVGFEPGTFWLLFQHLKPLGHFGATLISQFILIRRIF